MTYGEFIQYHLRGDAGVEERALGKICANLGLKEWQCFQLIYFYAMTYNIPSALDMLYGERSLERLEFRTDRRWVKFVPSRYTRMLAELSPKMMQDLKPCRDTTSAYKVVRSWYFFARYAAYMFLEVYIQVFRPKWEDNLVPDWEPKELYTKGARLITNGGGREVLNSFLGAAKRDTNDNVFAIETSLCAVAKMEKGTRYDGYYTERMIKEAERSKWKNTIFGAI